LHDGASFFACGPSGRGTLIRPDSFPETDILTRPERLKDRAEAQERRGAVLAQTIAAELMRPTRARAPLVAALAELADLHADAAQGVSQLRRAMWSTTPDPARAARAGDPVAVYVRAMRTRLRLWSRAAEAAQICTEGHEWPLLPPPRPWLGLETAEETILARMFTRAHLAVNPVDQTPEAKEFGCFADIPLGVGRFMICAHLAYRIGLARKTGLLAKFIDVGCGGGIKVALASELFPVADGIDYDPAYVDTAARSFAAMGMLRCGVQQADGLTFDRYGVYDVIYFYQPMSVAQGLENLERQIVAGARPGTILFAPYDGFTDRAESLGCLRILDAIFVKGMTEAEGQALVDETRRMGPHISSPDQSLPHDAGWVAPLWRACQANGIDPARLQDR
jgi:SAM-dependent methyltransferase